MPDKDLEATPSDGGVLPASPLTLWLTNNTPYVLIEPASRVSVEPYETKRVVFKTAHQLDKARANLAAIERMRQFTNAYPLSDQAPKEPEPEGGGVDDLEPQTPPQTTPEAALEATTARGKKKAS